ncbi:MAG: oleoyl-ACP hydrolase [Clostridia bacterium]|nr:oleoyl-ACP hydrolase [Clostridia bacterium]
MVFEHKYRVEIEDVDKDNLLSNRALLGILEDIACFHAASLGQGPLEVTKNGFAWLLLNWRLKVIKRSTYGDVLTVKTWPRQFDRVSSYRDFEISDENGQTVAIGSSKWFVMNLSSRRPIRLTEEYTNPYCPISDVSVFEEEMPKLNETGEYEYKTEYTVGRRDIDSNKHMHNINYLDLAYEVLPEEVYENNEFNNVEIEYKKEVMYKDKIECYYSKNEEKHVVTIKTGDKVNAIVVLS